jgi:DNA-binding XRE family transcriptional regulator
MERDWERLGRAFAKARTAAGLTQEQAAEQLHVSRTPVQAIERGRQPVGLVSVLASALLICAAGLVLLRLLEARTTRGLRLWTVVAVGVALLSVGGPAGAPTAAAVAGLASLHLMVALVLVLGLRAVRRGR